MRRFSWLIWVGWFSLALVGGLPAAGARAEVSLHAELTNESTNSTLTDKETGNVTSTDRNRFEQLYNLEILRHVYPNLSFRAGGIFGFTDESIKSEGTTTKSGTDRMHPFLELNLTNPIFSCVGGYEKTEVKQTGTDQISTKDTRDQFHGRFLWAPVDFPRLNLNYTKTHRYDDQMTVDQELDDFALNLRYDWKEIFGNYAYTKGKTDDRLNGLKSWNNAHDGRINFSHNLTRNLNLSAGYRGNYSTNESSGGGQPFLTPLLVGGVSGFYVLDDNNPIDWSTPPQISAGNFLVDGVKSGSSPINLGLNGDETKNVSFGLDFGFVTQISTIRVWVDRDASEVENTLVLTLYTSDDNLSWTQLQNVPVRYVGGIDNYFEITLSNSVTSPLSARYIKVVTSPLTAAQDPAGHFQDLYVTEVEPFRLDEGNIILRNVENNADMGLQWRLDPKTTMGYNTFYRNQRTDAETMTQHNTSWSQTVNLNRIITRIFSGNVRGTRQERQTPTQETLDYSYGASLAAGWLDTFRQTLSYNGSNSEINRLDSSNDQPKEVNTTDSVLLRNVVQLYRGWSANVDFGYTWSTPWEAGTRYTKLFRVESTIIPNPKLTLNTSYTYSRSYSISLSDQPPSEDQRIYVSAAFSPTSAISLFTRQTVIKQSGETKVYQNYSIDWSPFPDGNLQLFLSYNENLTNEGDNTKGFLTGFDWRINNAAALRTSYNISEIESVTTKIESKFLTIRLRFSL